MEVASGKGVLPLKNHIEKDEKKVKNSYFDLILSFPNMMKGLFQPFMSMRIINYFQHSLFF